MVDRFKRIIEAKTGGNMKMFCDTMGWTQQYLSNMMNGRCGIGLNPVRSIIERYEDINPRWLITGKGEMYVKSQAEDLKAKELQRIEEIVSLGRYVPVMDDQERQRYSNLLLLGVPCGFSPTDIVNLEYRLHDYKANNEGIVEQAMNESICKTQKA